jgi:hypothetical protein
MVPTDGGWLPAERTAKRLRTEIRVRFGFHEATVADAEIADCLATRLPCRRSRQQLQPMIERLDARCRNWRLNLRRRNRGQWI